MHNSPNLQHWDASVARYLAHWRALGRSYRPEEWALGNVRAFLLRHAAEDLDSALFDAWRSSARRLSSSSRVKREVAVYNFCRFRRRDEPACFLPDALTITRRQVNAPPTLITPEHVVNLLQYVAALPVIPSIPLRRPVLRMAFVLLYTAGLRRGELARLTLADVAAEAGVLRIRASKFHKSRWVPLSPSATGELRRYLAARHAVHPVPTDDAPLLCRSGGRAFYGEALYAALRRAMQESGIWTRRPRVHDFRHSFAVAALMRWYEEDGDVQANLPRLALYMGHVSIASTVWYLRLMPEVVALAGQRFERACGTLVQGGAP
jgi:integrase